MQEHEDCGGDVADAPRHAFAKLPPQVRERVSQGVDRATTTMRQRPLPTAAITAAAVFVVLILIRMLRAKQ